MCMLLDERLVSVRYVLFAVTLAGSVALYQQFLELRVGVQEARMQGQKVPELDASLGNTHRSLDRLREDLQDARAAVSRLRRELRLLQTDRTGLVDYAYGGKVEVVGDTESMSASGLAVLGVQLCGGRPEERLLESAVLPGDCWALRGWRGAAVVRLVAAVLVTSVSLEHASQALLPPGASASAPRGFSLWGVPEDSADSHLFGEFQYSLNGPDVQTFPVTYHSPRPFRLVEFRVLSNHGHPEFTCVYRLRVHGHPPPA